MASLAPKTGVLDRRLAAHLLRRATYRVTKERIDQFTGMTPAAAVADLFNIPAATVDHPIDLQTGQPWFTNYALTPPAPTTPTAATSNNGPLRNNVKVWWINEARLDPSIGHKMMFFLHSAWTVASTEGPAAEYFDYLQLLRAFALGNFKTLAYKMSIDNQMLRYLDNSSNNKNSPNENYAREFLELFTIGKGPQIGPSDYTNYQEHDVAEGAKVLSGWKLGGRDTYYDADTGLPTGWPNYNQHTQGDKTFSTAFQTAVITGATDAAGMPQEFQDYIEMIFAQDETARAICRKLYIHFVGRKITTEVEADIIEGLANTFRTNNYELTPVVTQLLLSQHFYNEDSSNKIVGGMLKSPLELFMTAMNFFNVTVPDPVSDAYNHYHYFYKRSVLDVILPYSGMTLFTPTNVAGYPAYYQEPDFHRSWFSSSTIISRYKLPEQLLTNKRVLAGGALGVQLSSVDFILNSGYFNTPSDAGSIIDTFADYLLPESIDTDRRNYFLSVLLGDFDEAYWTNLWGEYTATGDPDDIKTPLDDLIKAFLYSPEYQLM